MKRSIIWFAVLVALVAVGAWFLTVKTGSRGTVRDAETGEVLADTTRADSLEN